MKKMVKAITVIKPGKAAGRFKVSAEELHLFWTTSAADT